MVKSFLRCQIHFLFALFCMAANHALAQNTQVSADVLNTVSTLNNPLYFTPNVAQWGHSNTSLAQATIPGGAIFINPNGLRILTESPNSISQKHQIHHHRGKDTQFVLQHHVTDITFANCNQPKEVLFLEPAPWYENFYLGNDPQFWKSQIQPCARIVLKDIYPKIDIHIYFSNNALEFDWVLRPGANPNEIGLQIDKNSTFALQKNQIVVKTSVGQFQINAPKAYQKQARKNKSIPCKYTTDGNTIGLKIGQYNPELPLTIDPILVFSTYSGSQGDNFGFTATYDTSGCLYAGGIVDANSRKYPVTTGAFQTTYGGGGIGAPPVQLPCDISISKYSPDGSKLLFATYMGGFDDEYPHSLCVDPFNNLLVFGTTLSPDFPVHPDSAYSNTHEGDYDIFVNKLNNSGTQLLGGTFIGGSDADGFQTEIPTTLLVYNYADNYRGDITTDNDGNIFVATCTRSNDFPTTPGALQAKPKGETDAAIICLNNSLSTIKWATLLGGDQDDAAYSIKVDDTAHLFVGGGTMISNNFPIAGNGYRKSAIGDIDGFITRFNKNNGFYQVGTYFGSTNYDQIYFIDLDIDNKVYFTGQTEGNLTRSAGTYGKTNTSQFIGRFSNDLKNLEFITTFGNRTTGAPELSPSAFMVDNCYNIYFSGWGSNIGVGNAGTTGGLPITADAHQKTTDNNDFYLIVLGKDAKTLKYASYFGGNLSDDHVDGGTSRFDNRGIIYQSVCASCPNSPPGLNDFPTSPSNVAFKNNVSIRCSNASFKLDFRLGYSVDAIFTAKPEVICLGQTIDFLPVRRFNATYIWQFGDGDTSHQFNPSHKYKDTGTYIVKLTVTDSNSCNATATYEKKVRVTTSPRGAFNTQFTPCKPGVDFILDVFNVDSVIWDFGDGSKIDRTGPLELKTYTVANGTIKRNYQYIAGQYNAVIVIKNTASGCTDTLKKPIQMTSDSTHEVKIANVFTPNNDGKNDCFRVYGIASECEEAELRIFNRYGERIFFTKNLNECWNGRVNNDGPFLPDGTYFYQLNIIKSPFIKSPQLINGSINLIR